MHILFVDYCDSDTIVTIMVQNFVQNTLPPFSKEYLKYAVVLVQSRQLKIYKAAKAFCLDNWSVNKPTYLNK